MLYSIYPPEVVFADTSEQDAATLAAPELIGSTAGWGRYAEIKREGVRIIVYKIGRGTAKVARLISTDPRDYLDSRYSPGAEIRL